MKKKKKTILWQIEGEDIFSPSFVFGTMHVKDQRVFQSFEIVLEKIGICDSFATEFNLNDPDVNFDPNLMFLSEGQSLEDLISKKKFNKLKKVFQKYAGLDLEIVKQYLPLFITNILTERILTQDMPVSMDEHLFRYANSLNKTILGVETYNEQIEILNKIPLKYQTKSLLSIGKNFKKFRKQLHQLTKYYQNGEIQKLHKSAKKSIGGLRKILLYNRNKIMADRIFEMAKDQSLFAAIGVGHLAGEKGVLRLLKHKGLKVTPILLFKRVIEQ